MSWFIGAIAAIAVVVGLIAAYPLALHASEKSVDFTVQEKEPSTDSKPYRVFTTDGRTFSVEDSFWYWNFRASDRYGQLRVGKSYHCQAIGWRAGFFSAYPNLIRCAERA